MIAALAILGGLLAATIAGGFGFAYRAGMLRGDLKVAQDAAERSQRAVEEAEHAAGERVHRKDLAIAELKGKLRRLRERLQNHPDPEVRGNLAIDSVVELLQDLADADDEDPSGDHETGRVPTEDGSRDSPTNPG